MDSNGNQRKRSGRVAKPENIEGVGPQPQVGDTNDVLQVSALAVSPTPEEVESTKNVPAAECRRSSRKKIIKFDVRDLLNKNRKPHKIQIEARIDSNAPTTSKTSTATIGENSLAVSSPMSGDLLSKQKTFLEKSAIFRRYSISQEPKPPPPPLPLPPSLLGKRGDSKDASGSGGTTSRRLSRTQEFFSNVMIKPKQTTSLIVAQMESSAPSVSGKRKSLNRYVETGTNNPESANSTTVQKRRGRPSKTKIQFSEDSSKEVTKSKKLTPEKATNWKEYKACLAQQTGPNEDMNTKVKIEVSSQITLESLTTDVLLEISSSSSHNSNIEDFYREHKSLTDEQHYGKIKDDTIIELNQLPEVCIDKRPIINPTSNPKLIENNENQIKSIVTLAPQQVPEMFVEVIPRDSNDSLATEDKKKDDTNGIYAEYQISEREDKKENEKESKSSQSTIKDARNRTQSNQNESLQKPAEFKETITSTNLDDSSQRLKLPKASLSPDQTKYNDSIHQENCFQTNKEETTDNKRFSMQEITESKGKISPISDDYLYTDSKLKLAQFSTEQQNKSDNSLRTEKYELNTDNTNDPKQYDYMRKEMDTKDLQSPKEVTNTRENRSKHNNCPQEQDLRLFESMEEQRTSKRGPNKLVDSLQKEKNSKNLQSSRRSRSKHNSPQEKTDSQSFKKHDDKTELGVSLSKVIKQQFSESAEDEIVNIKSQQKLDESTPKDRDTVSDQSFDENKTIQLCKKGDSLGTNLMPEAGQSTEEAMKNTRSISKIKVSSPEENSINLLQSTKQHEIPKSGNSKQNKKVFTIQKKESSALLELKDNIVLPQTSEQTKAKEYLTKEEKISETSIQKQTETTPINKRNLTEKAIIDHKEEDNSEVKPEHEIKTEEDFENKQDNINVTTTKKPSRNKRNLEEESQQHAEYKKDYCTNKKPNEDNIKLSNTTVKSNIEDETNIDTNILISSEDLLNVKRTEPIPDPSIQVEQEKTPKLKIPINDNQEVLLSQHSTPSEKKSLTFSRTSSSSESENQSERSSYSSATTSSTSTRSYKSGDKLKISIKRISLPQSPSSSSSQMSTSEEQSSPSLSLSEDIKKKLPKAKRSKRLQKKFVEMLDNQGSTENIDDCFKKILTDIKDDLKISKGNVDIIETELQSTNVVEKMQANIAKESTVKVIKSVEELLAVFVDTRNKLEESIEQDSNEDITVNNTGSIELSKGEINKISTEESEKISAELLPTEDLIDPIKPTTSKGKNIKDNSTIKKRKSLRNRKENNSGEIDQETKESEEETEAAVKEIPLEENKLLRNLKENDSEDSNSQDSKETVSEAAEADVQQQHEQHIESQISQETQGKFTESKQKQKKKVKEQRLSLTKSKQQQKRKPNDEQTAQQENENEKRELELEKQLEVQTVKNKQEEQIQLKEQEGLLPEPSRLKKITVNDPPVEQEKETAIELKAEANDEQLIVSNDSSKDNILTKEIREKESLFSKFTTDKTKKIDDDSCEFKNESSIITTKIDVNENTPTTNESLIDKSSFADNSDKNVSGKSSKSSTDSKDIETSKITSTRSKTGKDKTISVAESSKTSIKSSKEFAKADIQNPENRYSKICSKEEITSVKAEETFINVTEKVSTETSPTQNIEELSSAKDKETSLLPHKEPNEFAIDVIDKESCNSLSEKSLPSNTVEETTKYSPESTELRSPKPLVLTKTKTDIEKPTSAKRKSLRNQKDKNGEDTTAVSSIETNEQDEKSLEKQSEELNEESNANQQIKDKIEEPVFTALTQGVKENTLDTLTNVDIEEPVKVTKKRGRKSRFKNLYSPEVESETENSTGKQTPIDDTILAEKIYEQPLNAIGISEVVVTIDNKADKEAELVKTNAKDITVFAKENSADIEPLATIAVQETEDLVKLNIKEMSSTKLDIIHETAPLISQTAPPESYLIKNVSIETNTLLDILRTVQSNTAAALEANKKTENPTQEISVEDENNSAQNMQKFLTAPEDLASTSQDRNLAALKSLRKLETDSNTNSPTRCDAASPLILKKVNISPTRSDSNSPLTLKKVGLSPTRSDTSSPLTLKKVTRRYERRSRRGEDSAHKTLEETFAEIAAQSSKAVLAAKSFDSNEEFPIGVIKEKDDELPTEHEVETTAEIIEEAKLSIENQEKIEDINKQSVADFFEKLQDIEVDSAEIEEKIEDIMVSQVSEHSKNIYKTEKSEDIEKSSAYMAVETSETNISEKESESAVPGKVTPARRGRKPKNRSMEIALAISNDGEIKNTPKVKKEVEKSTVTILKDKDPAKDLEKAPSEEVFITENLLKTIEELFQKPDASLKTESKIEDDIIPSKDDSRQQDSFTEISELSETPEMTLKSQEDSKITKKSIKKRDSSKELPSTVAEADHLAKVDDAHTPKQAAKKKDSLLAKCETKSLTKKSTKKIKNNEDELIVTQKEDNVSKTTTPPPKRGRKPKNSQEPLQTTTSSKKKNKKESLTENDDAEILEEKLKDLESECESVNSSVDKSLDEKMAKKKRQKKLKEAFEAALADDLNKNAEITSINTSCPSSISSSASSTTSFGLTMLNKSPPPEQTDSLVSEAIREACLTPVEEDPDPLKDIEKFIADGVNLLKKDYKLDEDSVGDVITTTTKTNEIEDISIKATIEEDKPIYNTFETPTDTPITTPSITPPPKSPTSIESSTPDEISGVRRSHRIKLITQTPKALVGRGLVRDKERFSIKDDVETKSHYTLDDHLLDLAEVEAKNAKFLKEMEERLSNFQVIKENEYLCERVISREARKMICDCFLTHEEEERGELGCGEDCLNRLLMIECGPECNVKERCTNKRFQKLLCSPCRVFRTEKKGFGIMADIEILPGEFIMEYVGEVIDTDIFEQRRIMYSQDKNRHYYFMALRSDAIIDATIQGNISRFINHSCDPNAETQKWTVNGELRIGFFSRKSIMPGEEITFNYQYQRYGREAQRCYCESSNCRGWIGQEPTSDEGEQIDDDDYEESEDDEEEEEEQDTSNLLVHDDDEDSDASVTDPEEVQKKLEMAAAQAEVELAPINISEDKDTNEDALQTANKENDDSVKTETEEEDSKSKFKKLLSKMAEKVAAKQKQNKRQQKLQRKKKSKESSADLTNKLRFSEDPDIEDEVEFLRECGLKNQSDTLRLSRLMVRAKLVQTRLNLLDILRKGDLPCRRLFLDYHGLRLVHGWMSEDAGNMQIRLALLQTLDTLPIANKTVLTDSKVMQMVRNWCGSHTSLSPNEDSSSSNSNSQDNSLQPNTNIEEGSDLQELHKLALKLITTWEGLPEIFRIPKKERIEQMKEHEREADRQYAANAETEENKTSTDRYRRNRFGTCFKTSTFTTATPSNRFTKPNNGNPLRTLNTKHESITNLSKAQRREMFAAKVARDEAEKRMAEERREFETKCRFFGLDPKKTRTQDVPFCVNPATGQWYSVERKPIITPPSYTHVQVPIKPKSTDPNDYQLPAVCSTLTAQWKYAITPQGKIYYYHIKYRIPQWEPPTAAQLQLSEMEAEDDDSDSELTTTAGEDSSEDDDEILIGMDAVQLRAYIDRKVETRRQKRYQRLVDQRAISPRREEDRVYNQIEVRKYKENKEKIRKRKEEIRRKRAEALRQSSLNMCTLGSVVDTTSGPKLQTESDEELGVLPIQDYLLSSDEDGDLKADVNSALIDKIVEGEKIVDELDALTSKRQLKRPLPPHRDLNEPSTSSLAVLTSNEKQEYKKRKLEKKDKKKPKDQDAKYRKNKEKFRCEIAGIIVHYLKPYRRESCPKGHIQSNDDFNHLARKLTHFVMIKELKYCESVGQTLVVTESVKNKSREFIKKYMAKYGVVYIKPSNDPDFKDIPFTL